MRDKPDTIAPENTAKPEKIPGPAMRFVIRAQAGLNLLSAVATPVWTAVGIARGEINVPLPGGTKHFDLTSPAHKVAAAGIGLVSATYGSMNAIARLRTAKDAATQEKINHGTLDINDAPPLKSGHFDVVLTRMNAGLSGAIAVGSGIFTARSLLDPTLSPDQKTQKAAGAITTMAVTGVMSVSKWRAANATQKQLDAQKGRNDQSHAARIERERETVQTDTPSRG